MGSPPRKGCRLNFLLSGAAPPVMPRPTRREATRQPSRSVAWALSLENISCDFCPVRLRCQCLPADPTADRSPLSRQFHPRRICPGNTTNRSRRLWSNRVATLTTFSSAPKSGRRGPLSCAARRETAAAGRLLPEVGRLGKESATAGSPGFPPTASRAGRWADRPGPSSQPGSPPATPRGRPVRAIPRPPARKTCRHLFSLVLWCTL